VVSVYRNIMGGNFARGCESSFGMPLSITISVPFPITPTPMLTIIQSCVDHRLENVLATKSMIGFDILDRGASATIDAWSGMMKGLASPFGFGEYRYRGFGCDRVAQAVRK